MSHVITLYKDAYYPQPVLTLKDKNTGDPGDPDSWDPIDVSSSTTSVRVDFYNDDGSTTPIASATCTKINGGADGKVQFIIPTAVFATVGRYNARAVIDRNGNEEPVDEKLVFNTRERN